MKLTKRYESRYEVARHQLFPTEFVVRWFKGTYPNWKLIEPTRSKKVLDLGFGDGRNFSLFLEQGLEVFGVEISEKIVEMARLRFRAILNKENLKVGFNGALPFPDQHFDYIVACHSLYYMERNGSIQKNIEEAARCLKSGAFLLCSIPKRSSYLVTNSDKIDTYHVVVRNDPVGLRDGEKVGYADTEAKVIGLFSGFFSDITIGSVENDWWGISENCWIVSCRKAKEI